jgi:hypothetical protein
VARGKRAGDAQDHENAECYGCFHYQ